VIGGARRLNEERAALRAKCNWFEGCAAMSLFRNASIVFLVPIHWAVFGLLYLVIVLGLVLAGLDSIGPPVLGWTLYPIEHTANALVFARAVTQVHGNGTALLFLSLLAGLAYATYRIAVGIRRLGRASHAVRLRS
jgi:hypothetical protein